MSTDYVERSTTVIDRIDGHDLVPHAIRLLSEGAPVLLARLAAAAGRRLEEVDAALSEQTGAERDADGRLVGLWLTLRPTPHRFLIPERTLYAWCASDALTFPVILGSPGVVESTCALTSQPIRAELTPDRVARVDPPGAVVTAVRPAGQFADLRAAVCRHGLFFSSPQAATRWAAEHPDGEIRPVEQAFALDREVVTQLGWTPK